MSYIIEFLKFAVIFIAKIVALSVEQKDKIVFKYIQRQAKKKTEKLIPKNFRKNK